MLIHNVYFWLKEDLSAEDKHAFERGLASLCGIDLVRSGHYGAPAGTTRDVVVRDYSYGLTLAFDDQAAQDVYQDCSTHQQFVADHRTKWVKVVVYDIETR